MTVEIAKIGYLKIIGHYFEMMIRYHKFICWLPFMRPTQYIILLLFFWAVCGCDRRAFPENKFTFSTKYRNLIGPYNAGDTLLFRDIAGSIETFVISGIDSIMVNTKGWFMNQRPYKSVSFTYNQLPSKQWTHEVIERDANNNILRTTSEDNDFISLGIDPETQDEGCDISFKNFRGVIEPGKDSIFFKPIIANGITIDNYYVIENVALDLVKYSTDIKTVYIDADRGIIAYQDQNANWWTKAN